MEQAQEEKEDRKYILGKLKYVDLKFVRAAKRVLYGSILLNLAKAMVLFDPSASQSFISNKFVEDQKIVKLPSKKPIIIRTPKGEMKAEYVCPKVSVIMNGKDFRENLNVLELTDIDLILGSGWFTARKGLILYDRRTVLVTTPSGERIEYKGIPPSPKESALDLQKDDGSKMQGVLGQCQCCKYYGFPCLQNKSNKEVNESMGYEIGKEEKRKSISLDPPMQSSQQLNSTTLPQLALISSQMKPDNKESRSTQVMPTEVCIDEWTITYKEFQPRKAKRAKQQADNNVSSHKPMKNNIAKDPDKRRCFHCHHKGHYSYSCSKKNQQP